jgi:cell division protein FtsI/penicillin-binding protein 2
MPAIRDIDPLQAADRLDPAFEADWRAGVRRRTVFVLCVLALWTVGIEARLVQLQVFQRDELVAKAVRQQERETRLPAKRGDIVDRNGQMLAYSVDTDTVVADPSEIEDPARAAVLICGALADCDAAKRALIVKRLTGTNSFAYVARQVSEQQAARVSALKLPGLTLMRETRRYYPKYDLAAHVLGGVGVEDKGLAGVEAAFDEVVRGHEGLALVQKDARQKRMQTRVEQAATGGATLELTLDLYLQHIAERELRAGVEGHHARAGTVIIMDPETGEILALANYPAFNPNLFGQAADDVRRNRAIQEIYEPGSTFKIVTASAALEEGVWKTSDVVDCDPGYLTFGSRRVIEAHGGSYGPLSFENVIVKSSNIGAIRIGLRVGAERMLRYVRRFGFGEAPSPDFRGQSRGIVESQGDVTDSALASMSMGYEVGVTPLQMVTAVSAVANGGMLVEPHIVRATLRDGRRDPVEPKMLRRAINTETAATLTSIMEDVVVNGTAKAARLDHYQVAGKTGTAQKLEDKRYSHTDYNASFVGFVPSRKPVFSILVVIDSPQAGLIYGGEVAAPIFKRIAEAALRQRGVPASINPTPPMVIVADADEPAARPVRTTSIPTILQFGGRTLMPDVRGLSARDAVRILGHVGLSVRFSGSGIVIGQTPAPGEAIDGGGSSLLLLERLPAEAAKAGGGGGR